MDDELLVQHASSAGPARSAARCRALVPAINRSPRRFAVGAKYTDRSLQGVHHPAPGAVPGDGVRRARAAALRRRRSREVRRAVERHGQAVTFPVEVRVAAADDVSLSTAFGRDSAYLAVHVHRRQPHEAYFGAVEAVMRDLDGRPHWGKLHTRDRRRPAARLPAVRRVRRAARPARPRTPVHQRLPSSGCWDERGHDHLGPADARPARRRRCAGRPTSPTWPHPAPGARLRPHVKAHKTTALARGQAAHGHRAFTCATIREVEGMVAAGLGDDLLLANEVLDARRLGALPTGPGHGRGRLGRDRRGRRGRRGARGARRRQRRAAALRLRARPTPARLADLARSAGLEVRGVMGYEGHLMLLADADQRRTADRGRAWPAAESRRTPTSAARWSPPAAPARTR